MTKEDIIRMAREVGIVVTGEAVWKLCELVAAAEREECAKVCEETTASWTEHTYNSACIDCAAAIRARGEKLSSQDNLTKSPINRRYTCHVCNRQEMVRAKFDEESG